MHACMQLDEFEAHKTWGSSLIRTGFECSRDLDSVEKPTASGCKTPFDFNTMMEV